MSAKLRNFLSRWTAPAAVHSYPIDVVSDRLPAGTITVNVPKGETLWLHGKGTTQTFGR